MKRSKQVQIDELKQRVKQLRNDMLRAFHILEENQTSDARVHLDDALYTDYIEHEGEDT